MSEDAKTKLLTRLIETSVLGFVLVGAMFMIFRLMDNHLAEEIKLQQELLNHLKIIVDRRAQ